MFSRKVQFVVLLLIGTLLSACASQGAQTPANTSAATTPSVAQANAKAVSFNDDVLPIFENNCMNCHDQERLEEGLSLRTYSDMMAGSKNGAVVVPGDAAHSLLAQSVASQKMPKRGPKLTADQVQLIVNWINQGAQDN